MVIPCSFFNLLSSAFLFPVGVQGALWIETCLVRSSLLLIKSALLIRSALLLIRSACLIKSTWNIFRRWSVSTEFCLRSSPRNLRSASRTFVSTDICFWRPSRRRSLISELGKFPETFCSKLWLEKVRAIFGNFEASFSSTLTLFWHFREAFKSAFLKDTVLHICLWKCVIVGKWQISGIQKKSCADVVKLEFQHPDNKEILHSNVLDLAWSFEACRQCGCSIDRWPDREPRWQGQRSPPWQERTIYRHPPCFPPVNSPNDCASARTWVPPHGQQLGHKCQEDKSDLKLARLVKDTRTMVTVTMTSTATRTTTMVMAMGKEYWSKQDPLMDCIFR